MKTILRLAYILLFISLPVGAQSSSADSTTRAFFAWYQQAGDRYRDSFSGARAYFTPELYSLLERGFRRTPSDDFWVDFDPFVNAQVSAERFEYGEPYLTDANNAFVIVRPFMEIGGGTPMAMPDIKVYLTKSVGQWQVANLIYTGDNSFELRQYLLEGLARSGESGGAPNAQDQSLADDLLGTWVHKSTSQTPDGEARPLTVAVIKWTFKPGDKCDFYQKVGSGKPMEATDRTYSLVGNTITLDPQTKYTVIKNEGAKMVWKNHRLGDYYHVVRE